MQYMIVIDNFMVVGFDFLWYWYSFEAPFEETSDKLQEDIIYAWAVLMLIKRGSNDV